MRTRRIALFAALCGGMRLALLAAALLATFSEAADALTISPLNGTPDASPYTQVSFLSVDPAQLRHVSAVGSRSGPHAGRLAPYASAAGASFLPTHPFTQGETVSVTALVGSGRHIRRVSSSFAVARLVAQAGTASPAGLRAKPGTVQSFASQPGLHPPTTAVTLSSPEVAPGDVFLTPSHGYGQSGAMIIDAAGRLVWFQPAPRGAVAENLQVQSYLGSPVLVWWQGRITRGVGFGEDQIFNTSYQPVAQVGAGNGYQADLHAVHLTPEGAAFITAYTFVRADLSSAGGRRDGVLEDAILQEVDVRTGLVMFEWHAYGHVALSDSYYAPPYLSQTPWDYFHLNSISPDPWGDGNFVISARNTWSAYEINRHDGSVIWRLGGKRSSFHMGPGTGTAWQHDVRWQPDRTLTIFDNGAVPRVHSQSRVIHVRIDWAHRMATLISRGVHTPALISGSQGSDQLLPGESSFVGWGEAPYFSEFNASGKLIFDAHLPAPTQSYRAYLMPWSATPATPPSIAVAPAGSGQTVYASWNGATGVASWRVLGGTDPAHLAVLATTPRTGFETAIAIHSRHAVYALQALDSAGNVLAGSPPAHS